MCIYKYKEPLLDEPWLGKNKWKNIVHSHPFEIIMSRNKNTFTPLECLTREYISFFKADRALFRINDVIKNTAFNNFEMFFISLEVKYCGLWKVLEYQISFFFQKPNHLDMLYVMSLYYKHRVDPKVVNFVFAPNNRAYGFFAK